MLLIARDQKNNVLVYDGTGDLVFHHRKYDQFMKDNGLGGVIAVDDDVVPARPDDAFARKANGIANQGDFGAISYYQKAISSFMEKCERGKGLYLRSFSSQSIRDNLKNTNPIEYDNASKLNLLLLRTEVIRRYGGWTDDDGKLNFNAMNNIPKFDSMATVESGFFQLGNLRRQREGWGVAEQVYGEEFYRTYHLEGVERLTMIHAW